jgi:hypothetical protein
MRAERDGRVEAFKKDGYIYSWAEQWRADLGSELRPLSAHFLSNDASFTFIFLVGKAGVRALWKTGFDATVEVELATRWLRTLRNRDIRALERLTVLRVDRASCSDGLAFASLGSTTLTLRPKKARQAYDHLAHDPRLDELAHAVAVECRAVGSWVRRMSAGARSRGRRRTRLF